MKPVYLSANASFLILLMVFHLSYLPGTGRISVPEPSQRCGWNMSL